MKKYIYLLVYTILIQSSVFASQISSSCTYNGIPLYGRVKVVNSFEDFRVKTVSSFEDIRVKEVSSFADSCGKWKFVDSFEGI